MARQGRRIDFKQWHHIAISSGQSGATDGTLQSNGFAFDGPATILRARGYVQAIFDATQQVGDAAKYTFGLGIVSTDAFSAGAASMPDPEGEPDYPWLWWGQMFMKSQVAAGVNAWGTSAQRLEVDTKAMRRVQPGKTICYVCQITGAAGAPVSDITFGSTRILIGT